MSDETWDSLVRTRKALREFEANRRNVNEFYHDGTWLVPVCTYGLYEEWPSPASYDLPTPVPNNYPCTMIYRPIFNVSTYRRIRFTP